MSSIVDRNERCPLFVAKPTSSGARRLEAGHRAPNRGGAERSETGVGFYLKK
jgi:hypothetical protein